MTEYLSHIDLTLLPVWLDNLDSRIFLALNGLHSPMLDPIMKLLTGKFIWAPFYIFLIWLCWKYSGRKINVIIPVIGAIIIVALTDQTCSSIIRPAVERLRPANLENPLSAMTHIVDGYRGGRFGFPSCHAGNAFGVAFFLSLWLRRRWIVAMLFLWALLQVYTRIYLGVHYPGDIIVGAIIGMTYAAGTYFLSRRMESISQTRRWRWRYLLPYLPSRLTILP